MSTAAAARRALRRRHPGEQTCQFANPSLLRHAEHETAENLAPDEAGVNT
jgi:hypothetical protein